MYPPAVQLKGLPTNWNGMLAITAACRVMTFSAKLPPDASAASSLTNILSLTSGFPRYRSFFFTVLLVVSERQLWNSTVADAAALTRHARDTWWESRLPKSNERSRNQNSLGRLDADRRSQPGEEVRDKSMEKKIAITDKTKLARAYPSQCGLQTCATECKSLLWRRALTADWHFHPWILLWCVADPPGGKISARLSRCVKDGVQPPVSLLQPPKPSSPLPPHPLISGPYHFSPPEGRTDRQSHKCSTVWSVADRRLRAAHCWITFTHGTWEG